MTIDFYLNNDEQTHIYSLYDIVYNPFELGNTIDLSIIKLSNNEKEYDMFNNKTIKIVKENKRITINESQFNNNTNDIDIKYYCEIVS